MAICARSWRGRSVKVACKVSTLRRPVEKLKKLLYPSGMSPSSVGLENCCSSNGKCASNLVFKEELYVMTLGANDRVKKVQRTMPLRAFC